MLPNALSGPACEYATAIVLLAFCLKRIWAIDLELRAHRERQRARLREARRRAREAASERPVADVNRAKAFHPGRGDSLRRGGPASPR